MSETEAPTGAKLALLQADKLCIILHALLVAGEPHPAAVMVAGARLFMVGAQGAGLEKSVETFKEFVEGFPGIFPDQEEKQAPTPRIIVPTSAEVAAVG